jgi:ceramide glucosyltransferase
MKPLTLLVLILTSPLTLTKSLAIVSAIGTVCSLFFYFISTLSLASFLNQRQKQLQRKPTPDSPLPPITILKPLKGVDPKIWESFCSHCEQDYPQFQIIFGVSDPGDPAVEVVRRLQAKYPDRDIELIACNSILGTNIKVSNLVQMLPSARHEFLIVNDSDIQVPANYLREVMTPFADNFVGLVTCLYRGIAAPTLGSRLEALGISTDFIPGALTAGFLENGLHFGLGSTLAFRRSDLDAIGGFEVLLDYLADDYELGRRISAAGKRIELSSATVSTFLPAYTLSEFVEHQLRWSRTIRGARRWGYAGLIFTFGFPWAIGTVLAAHGAVWAWALFAMTFAARLAVGFGSAIVVLNDRQFPRYILLLPLRDLLAPLFWAASFMGNRIQWRGDVFEVKNGRLVKFRT